jgi:beta-glucosidase
VGEGACSAIIEAWYPGQAGGLAVGNVIAGKANPATACR